LVEKGRSVSDATGQVARRLGYAVQPTAVRRWVNDDASLRKKVAVDDLRDKEHWQHEEALPLFRDLAACRVDDRVALGLVADHLFDRGAPSEDTLRKWQIDAKEI
jgi:hypothetical protein